jgi:hypothetical protein
VVGLWSKGDDGVVSRVRVRVRLRVRVRVKEVMWWYGGGGLCRFSDVYVVC